MTHFGLEVYSHLDHVKLSHLARASDFDYCVANVMSQSSELLLDNTPSWLDNLTSPAAVRNLEKLDILDLDLARKTLCFVSPWIDLDNSDEVIRRNSEALFKMQYDWLKYCGVSRILIQIPSSDNIVNFSKCISKCASSLTNTDVSYSSFNLYDI
jgi:hypothetical protein